MARRRSTGKRLRFEILKRDGYRCRYCGATPVQALLRVDHVIAVANGGSDDPENLVTACHDCNAGKSDVPLEERRLPPAMTTEDAREHAEQLREFLAVQKDVRAAKRAIEDEVASMWAERFGGDGNLPAGIARGLGRALGEFDLASIGEAFDIIAGHDELGAHRHWTWTCESGRVRYFFGILRRWREGREERRLAAPRSPTLPPAAADPTRADCEWCLEATDGDVDTAHERCRTLLARMEQWKATAKWIGAVIDRARHERLRDLDLRIMLALAASAGSAGQLLLRRGWESNYVTEIVERATLLHTLSTPAHVVFRDAVTSLADAGLLDVDEQEDGRLFIGILPDPLEDA